MGHVVENSISTYFKYRPLPEIQSAQLPYSEDKYGWKDVTLSMVVPETASKEFQEHCITECACLSLHARLIQIFPHFTSIEQEFSLACDIIQWCSKLKPKLVRNCLTNFFVSIGICFDFFCHSQS